MILIEVYSLSGPHTVTELRELVTGLSLFGHALTLWFADTALQQQFEDEQWEEIRQLLDSVTLSCCPSQTAEKQQLESRALHRFCFVPVELGS